jgi:RNA polymerase sigma factor for flagellar operon FliA
MSSYDKMDEKELWIEYKETKNEKLREYFVRKYAPLVKHIAGKIGYKIKGSVEFDDLIGYGSLGLLDAIEKYDPMKNIKFNTYAMTRIQGSIYDELRNMDWIPRTIRTKSRKIEEAMAKIEIQKGSPATDEEIASELGVSVEELQDMYIEVNPTTIVSLTDIYYQNMKDGENIEVISTIEAPPHKNPDQILEKEEITKILAKAIKELPDKEKKVLILYYYEELTLKEIGEVLDITESRVSQLHTKAVMRLRAKISRIIGEIPASKNIN